MSSSVFIGFYVILLETATHIVSLSIQTLLVVSHAHASVLACGERAASCEKSKAAQVLDT